MTTHTLSEYLPATFTDLAAEKLGGKVLYATDDFFAEKENLIKPGRGVFIPDKYTDRGKWMDGWESRRKRTPGHDWCIIQLATAGRLHGFDIDTNHFLGNHPPFASVDAVYAPGAGLDALLDEGLNWTEVLPQSPLAPGSQNWYACHPGSAGLQAREGFIRQPHPGSAGLQAREGGTRQPQNNEVFTHLKLHIYPDGGVARFRAYGEVFKDWTTVAPEELVNLAAAVNGARALLCNDMFFSSMHNLLLPGRGENMGDGWETKRNRTPNNRDWIIVRLAAPGRVKKVMVDTCHFKGNYPDRCSLEGCFCPDDERVKNDEAHWMLLMDEQKLSAHREHFFEREVLHAPPVTHVRFNIFPDGGVSRLQVYGKVVG
ncbi:MAG: allantoicase [Lewinellaceae bacterium]|nr:allantoicase [Lewinellaceae bacterium]